MSDLLSILQSEKESFQRIDNTWRPKGLLHDIQTQDLLKDMKRRYAQLLKSEEGFQGLDRFELYLKHLKKLGLIVKRSNFVRRYNHLAFLQAVSEFYSIYGEVLRYLKIDQARGKIA